jgi:DNA invertase Pin-like site-specific DNA recombinase
VIDDQGLSGQSVEDRPGFRRPLAEVSLGHVGIAFGREMSRLARWCKHWHQLLELCGLFQLLIGDADGVYDPTDPNDRMLPGLRGMMSEAEPHVLRSRLHQGKWNKARRGELFTCVPIGYACTPDGGIAAGGRRGQAPAPPPGVRGGTSRPAKAADGVDHTTGMRAADTANNASAEGREMMPRSRRRPTCRSTRASRTPAGSWAGSSTPCATASGFVRRWGI